MEIYEIDSKVYDMKLPKDTYVFNLSKFHCINEYKVDKVHYLIGADSKERFAFSFGEKNNTFLAPFSSPFSSPVPLRSKFSVEQAFDFIKAFVTYAKAKSITRIEIYLPPSIYDYNYFSIFSNCLLNNFFAIKYLDINYSFKLYKINTDNYIETIEHNARKNLKKSLLSNLEFFECKTEVEKHIAYDIIEKNRKSRGYPLHMNYEQIKATEAAVNINYFLVKKEKVPIASAIVFDICKDIALVEYWGNLNEFEEYRPINFLSYNLIIYYKKRGFNILDIGISTELGLPNYGLCNFKESIGCATSLKGKFNLDLNV